MFVVGRRKQVTLINLVECTSYVCNQSEAGRIIGKSPSWVNDLMIKAQKKPFIKHYGDYLLVFHTDFYRESNKAKNALKTPYTAEYRKVYRTAWFKHVKLG